MGDVDVLGTDSIARSDIPAMTHRERLETALRGESLDPPPVSFWMHFPGRDHTADVLAEATVEFQDRYDLDLIKLMPTGMYSVMDYGVTVRPSPAGLGTTDFVSGPIQSEQDWSNLPSVAPDRGALGEQINTVRMVRAALGSDVPFIQTVFSPLTMVTKLAGNTLPEEHLESRHLRTALERLTHDVIAFGEACLEAGADGFFFATMHANGAIDRDLYERLGAPYDLQVLEALRPRAAVVVLHLHGDEPFFDLADRYPVDIVSWEDRETEPSLLEALERTKRCLLGGLGRFNPLTHGTPDEVAAQVRNTVLETGGRRVIIAPGCTLPVSVPEENLRALVRAVRG